MNVKMNIKQIGRNHIISECFHLKNSERYHLQRAQEILMNLSTATHLQEGLWNNNRIVPNLNLMVVEIHKILKQENKFYDYSDSDGKKQLTWD